MFAVFSTNDPVPIVLESLLRKISERIIIFYNQNSLGTAGIIRRGLFFFLHVRILFHFRQIDLEGRTPAGLAIDPDKAIVLFYNAVNCGQAQSRAVADLLCGEKRLEDMFLGLFVYSAAGIAYSQYYIMTRLFFFNTALTKIIFVQISICRLNCELAYTGHGVPGIDRKVYDHLLNLAWVYFNLPQCRGRNRQQLNILPNKATEHLFYIC